MDSLTGFEPIENIDAKILILGSMPSETSLRKQQYYAHQRNAFWPIILSIYAENPEMDYSRRKKLLIQKHIAVWDVLKSCHRSGSLDSAIQMDTIITNDFNNFFSTHRQIQKVCFNGAKAETIFSKTVIATIKEQFSHLNYVRLPSTSPAHASITLQDKIKIWKKELSI